MFATFDYSETPLIKVKFAENIIDDEDLKNFMDKWFELYDKKKYFSFLFNTTNCGLISIRYCYIFSKFLKELKSKEEKYLNQSIIIVNSKWIRYLLKTTFYIQKPISPVYMVTDESTALEVYKRVIDNKGLDGLDVSFVDN
tara:strand:+ start:86 stop:508 length:423 start_codon:yes stop_codon:yes gene_type:complete